MKPSAHVPSDAATPAPSAPLPSSAGYGLVAGHLPKAIVPRTLAEALQLAKAVVASRMAPDGLETPEACMIAILHGLEVGLTPLMALQRIAVVGGRPTLWGDGALALVRASGLCRSVKEWVEGDGPQTWQAHCEVLRKGESEPVTRSFCVEDARRAGLWNRSVLLCSNPRRMLQMRARAFALRDVFPDVLGGLYLREELEDEGAPAASTAALPAAKARSGPSGQASRRASPVGKSSAPQPQRHSSAVTPGPRKASGWVRLRAPRDAIRLRAPVPPGYAADGSVLPLGGRQARPRLDPDPSPMRDAATSEEEIGSTDPTKSATAARLTLEAYDEALACAQDGVTLREVEEAWVAALAALSREDAAEAERIRTRHAGRIGALTCETVT